MVDETRSRRDTILIITCEIYSSGVKSKVPMLEVYLEKKSLVKCL